VIELAQPAGILLGVDPEVTHPVVTSRLCPDDIVVLYTDGLVERRPGCADEPLNQIKRTLAEASMASQGSALAPLRALLPLTSPDDDTCILAIHMRGAAGGVSGPDRPVAG
jgi:serine phosphatase RsbU (regulator of sigma subunit)